MPLACLRQFPLNQEEALPEVKRTDPQMDIPDELSRGLVLGCIGIVWSGRFPFGVVIGAALMCSMLTAGFMGTTIPLVSKRLGFDPATTAGPFETAFQDVIGFAVFLWLASMLLGVLT